jgi:hypothetical protein
MIKDSRNEFQEYLQLLMRQVNKVLINDTYKERNQAFSSMFFGELI